MRLWRKRRDPFAVCIGVAPLAAMAAIAIHSYSDFNLHIPANFLILVAIMAIGYSVIHLERHRGGDKTLCRYHVFPLRYKGAFVLLLTIGVIFWTGFWTIRHFVAEAYCNTVHNSTLNRDQNPPINEIKKAISWDPWNARYHYKLSREWIRIRDDVSMIHSPESRIQNQLEIVGAMEEAVRLNPFRAEYHTRLGWEYAYLWQDTNDRKRWLSAADLSMDRAAYFAGEKNPGLHVLIGNYWVVRSKTMAPSDPEWDAVWAEANWHYKKALNLDKREDLSHEIEEFVRRFYPMRGWLMVPILDKGYGG
jgi:hypothetical protein